MRYASEVRSPTDYFADIGQGDLRADHMQLAEQLIESHTAEFDASALKDRYQDALLDLVKAKIEGAEPAIPQEEEAGKVINLMDALKASVEKGALKKPPAKSVKKAKQVTKRAKAKRA